jgi:ligand-binding sensor domain-containing protein
MNKVPLLWVSFLTTNQIPMNEGFFPRMRGILRAGCCTLGICFYFFTAAVAQLTGLPQPEVISDRQGLPQAFVSAIVQDRQGFIWMATRDGLCRYDGTRFKIFQPDPNGRPSLSFSGVSTLTVDDQNRIWVGNIRGGIDVFDPLKEEFTNFTNQPFLLKEPSNPGLHEKTFKGGVPLQFYRDHQGNFWVWYGNAGLIRVSLQNQQVRRFEHNPADSTSLVSNWVNAVMEDRQGQIWVATTGGLSRIDPKTNQIQNFRAHSGQHPRIRRRFPKRISPTSSSNPTGTCYWLHPGTSRFFRPLRVNSGLIHFPSLDSLPEVTDGGKCT